MDGGLDPETICDVSARPGKWAELDFRSIGHSPHSGLATRSNRASNREVIAKQGGRVENSTAMGGGPLRGRRR